MYSPIVLPLQMWTSAVLITMDAIKMQLVSIHKVVLFAIATKDFPVMEPIAQVRISSLPQY